MWCLLSHDKVVHGSVFLNSGGRRNLWESVFEKHVEPILAGEEKITLDMELAIDKVMDGQVTSLFTPSHISYIVEEVYE